MHHNPALTRPLFTDRITLDDSGCMFTDVTYDAWGRRCIEQAFMPANIAAHLDIPTLRAIGVRVDDRRSDTRTMPDDPQAQIEAAIAAAVYQTGE